MYRVNVLYRCVGMCGADAKVGTDQVGPRTSARRIVTPTLAPRHRGGAWTGGPAQAPSTRSVNHMPVLILYHINTSLHITNITHCKHNFTFKHSSTLTKHKEREMSIKRMLLKYYSTTAKRI